MLCNCNFRSFRLLRYRSDPFFQEHKISVPTQLSVAGFDDIPLCQMVYPSLTTVKQDGALRAKVAVEGLLSLKNEESVPTTVTLPVTLVVRDSTAPI